MGLWNEAAVGRQIMYAVVKCADALGANLNPLQWAESAGKSRLQIVGDLLISKQEKAVLFERRAHGPVAAIARGDVYQGDAAHLYAEMRAERDEFDFPLLRRLDR